MTTIKKIQNGVIEAINSIHFATYMVGVGTGVSLATVIFIVVVTSQIVK